MNRSDSPAQLSRRRASDAELEGCVRDLMGLLALPALWTARDPATILAILCESLQAVLPLRVCYASGEVFGPENRFVAFRVDGAVAAVDDPTWKPFLERCARMETPGTACIEDSPLGTLYVVRFDMDHQAGSGVVYAAASAPDFPTITQTAVMRAATTLAASGLQGARLMREREEASRAKDEFLAMLGHELRNPLAPIVTALNLMKMRSGNRVSRESEIIERQVGHLVRLVDDLLDISRVARGKVELKRELVNVSEVIAKAVETASPLLEQRRHYLTLTVPSEGVALYGDPTRLAQVFANLLTNAAKYTEPGGEIEVRAELEGDSVRVTVKDTGAGISPELLPHVFDLFQQGRTTLDRAQGGLGIGLALVKSLTTMHGGTVSARSEGAGHGSEFSVTLPLGTPALIELPEQQARRQALAAPRTERVLVVDDNQDAAELIAETLRTVGYQVLVAYDAFQAISLAERGNPSVMVLDIGLPVMNGYELAVRVRETLGERAPRMVALTGYGAEHDRQRSRASGIETHLVKPVAADELVAAIEGNGPSE